MIETTTATKRCSKCGVEKPLSEFSPAKQCRDGYRPECKQCHNEAEKNRDKGHRVTVTYEYKRRERMKRLYGMTPEEFDAMFEAQGRRCAICPSTVPGKNRTTWCIDHSHSTGAVRAILCHDCNTMLGNAKDDPEILMSAVAYLLEHAPS